MTLTELKNIRVQFALGYRIQYKDAKRSGDIVSFDFDTALFYDAESGKDFSIDMINTPKEFIIITKSKVSLR